MLATDIYIAAAFIFALAIAFFEGDMRDRCIIGLMAEILFLFMFGVSYGLSSFIATVF